MRTLIALLLAAFIFFKGESLNVVSTVDPVAVKELSNYQYYKAGLPPGVLVDSIVIDKAAHEMRVFNHNRLLKKYRVCLGLHPVGKKQVAGDFKTPEGLYHINSKNPQSQYHKSLGISYPNKQDVLEAKKLGRSPGDDIVIHGLPNGKENVGPHRYRNDWTSGCIALRNDEIDELYDHVKVGTPILIQP